MKNLIILTLMGLLCIKCSGQNEFVAWLPEKYVVAVISGDTSAAEFLSPIEGFEYHSDSLFILTFKGELNSIKTKKAMGEDDTKYELLNLAYYINLKYNSMALVSKLLKSKVTIFKHDNKLVLEIIEDDKVDTIYFINKIKEYNFKRIKSAQQNLMK